VGCESSYSIITSWPLLRPCAREESIVVDLSELMELPRSGKRSSLRVEKRRNMTPTDLIALTVGKPLEQVSPIASLRHQHHLLARLIGEGKSITESAEITGYSIAYISRLKTQDKAFQELISYYRDNVEEIYYSVHERLKGLGLNTIEELQERLAEDRDGFTNRELMELAQLAFDRSGFGVTHNIKATHTILTPDMIVQLKDAIAKKSNGTIREISSSNSGTSISSALIEGSVQVEKNERVSIARDGVSEESREVFEK